MAGLMALVNGQEGDFFAMFSGSRSFKVLNNPVTNHFVTIYILILRTFHTLRFTCIRDDNRCVNINHGVSFAADSHARHFFPFHQNLRYVCLHQDTASRSLNYRNDSVWDFRGSTDRIIRSCKCNSISLCAVTTFLYKTYWSISPHHFHSNGYAKAPSSRSSLYWAVRRNLRCCTITDSAIPCSLSNSNIVAVISL